jgi:hypothetical protein
LEVSGDIPPGFVLIRAGRPWKGILGSIHRPVSDTQSRLGEFRCSAAGFCPSLDASGVGHSGITSVGSISDFLVSYFFIGSDVGTWRGHIISSTSHPPPRNFAENESVSGTMGQAKPPLARLRASDVGRCKQIPLRSVPERGQISNDGIDSSPNKSGHVLQEHEARFHSAKYGSDGRPDPPVIVLSELWAGD